MATEIVVGIIAGIAGVAGAIIGFLGKRDETRQSASEALITGQASRIDRLEGRLDTVEAALRETRNDYTLSSPTPATSATRCAAPSHGSPRHSNTKHHPTPSRRRPPPTSTLGKHSSTHHHEQETRRSNPTQTPA